MKTLVISVVSLFVGLVVGWLVEHRHSEDEKNDIVAQMVKGMESSDRVQAARSVRAISLIGAGDAQAAVQLLAGPIADYCSEYGEFVRNDERSIKLREAIAELARTNQVVAGRLAEVSNIVRAKTP